MHMFPFFFASSIPTIIAFSPCLCSLVLFVAVGWQLSVDSLKLALTLLGTPEVMRFLDEFLMKMVTILITQRYVVIFYCIVVADGFLYYILHCSCSVIVDLTDEISLSHSGLTWDVLVCVSS